MSVLRASTILFDLKNMVNQINIIDKTTTAVKILSPTLHFYSYVLRQGFNETDETLNRRRQLFNENLQKIAAILKTGTDETAANFVKLLPPEEELISPLGTVLDLTKVPAEYLKQNSDRLYFKTGLINSRLAARCLNDTYFLRLTRYLPSARGPQFLDSFEKLAEGVNNLQIELGQTAILAGILDGKYSKEEKRAIAATCLSKFCGSEVSPEALTANEFLGSQFYFYPQPVTVKLFNELPVEAVKLTCVFLYENETTERQADKVYRTFQNLLWSYHKIHHFYSQSLLLKKLLGKEYASLERLTEEYAENKLNSKAWQELPYNYLEYQKQLSFLGDQLQLVEVNSSNYGECLRQMEKDTGEKAPPFLAEFEEINRFYREQMKSNIAFMKPAIAIFEKLMLSVQTQVNLEEAETRQKQLRQQAKLGQIIAGVGSAIALLQILAPLLAATLPPSPINFWLAAGGSLVASVGVGFGIGAIAFRWLRDD